VKWQAPSQPPAASRAAAAASSLEFRPTVANLTDLSIGSFGKLANDCADPTEALVASAMAEPVTAAKCCHRAKRLFVTSFDKEERSTAS
jgi:hypothetical protein